MTESFESLPLPEHPLLAAWASALNDAGYWAYVLDAEWRYVFETDELRLSYRDMGATTALPIGSHFFSAEDRQFIARRSVAPGRRRRFVERGSCMRVATCSQVHPAAARSFVGSSIPNSRTWSMNCNPKIFPRVDESIGVHDRGSGGRQGRRCGFESTTLTDIVSGVCVMPKPAAGMSHLARAAATADLTHLERMRVVERPDRHPAAILMADLEASSPLARHLSTAQYLRVRSPSRTHRGPMHHRRGRHRRSPRR